MRMFFPDLGVKSWGDLFLGLTELLSSFEQFLGLTERLFSILYESDS